MRLLDGPKRPLDGPVEGPFNGPVRPLDGILRPPSSDGDGP